MSVLSKWSFKVFLLRFWRGFLAWHRCHHCLPYFWGSWFALGGVIPVLRSAWVGQVPAPSAVLEGDLPPDPGAELLAQRTI